MHNLLALVFFILIASTLKADNIYPNPPFNNSLFLKNTFLISPEAAPDFEAIKENGERFKLSDLKGKVVYISFWASWCKPCLNGFVKNEKIRKQLEDKGIILLNVSMDKSQDIWKNTLNRLPINGLNIYVEDKPTVQNLYQITSLPLYQIVNKKGNFDFLSDKPNRNIIAEFEQMMNQ